MTDDRVTDVVETAVAASCAPAGQVGGAEQTGATGVVQVPLVG